MYIIQLNLPPPTDSQTVYIENKDLTSCEDRIMNTNDPNLITQHLPLNGIKYCSRIFIS